MKILQHFDKSKTSDFIIYSLKENEWDAFVNKLPGDFRLCYISDNKLNDRATKASLTASDFLEKYVVPSEPTIKSGDFGELLSFFAVRENFEKKGIILIAPRKWRWKDNKDLAAPGVDSVLFHIVNPKKLTDKDLLVTIESKMKAVKSKKHRIQEAIDHASKDKLSRLSKTLIWFEEKYAKLGKEKPRKMVQRFNDPATYGNFRKQHKAIVILDSTLEAGETALSVVNAHGIIAIVFSIKELKRAYEETRTNIINSI